MASVSKLYVDPILVHVVMSAVINTANSIYRTAGWKGLFSMELGPMTHGYQSTTVTLGIQGFVP